MNSNRAEVSKTLSLIETLDLPHPSGALLEAFVTETLHPVVAARYVNARLSAGEARSLVSDWIYIVESGKPPFFEPAHLEVLSPCEGASSLIILQ
jgi:hypothetical protein